MHLVCLFFGLVDTTQNENHSNKMDKEHQISLSFFFNSIIKRVHLHQTSTESGSAGGKATGSASASESASSGSGAGSSKVGFGPRGTDQGL